MQKIIEILNNQNSLLVKGIVQESSSSQKYKSLKGLDLEDILYTANVAKLYTNFDKQV